MSRSQRFVRSFAAAHLRIIFVAAAGMVAVVGAMCVLAWWAGQVAHDAASGASIGDLTKRLAIGIVLMALLSAAAAGRDLALTRLSGGFSAAMRARMLRALIRQPVAAIREQSAGEAVTRLGSDITLLHQALLRVLAIWFPSVVTTVVLLGAIIVTSPFLAIVTALLVLPVLFVTARSSLRLQHAVRDSQERVAKLGALIADAMAGVREAKVFRRELAIEERSRAMSDAIFAHTLREEELALTLPSLVTFAAFVGACGLVLAATWQFQLGAMDGAALTRFLVLLAMLAGPLQESARSSAAVTRVRTLMQRCQEMLDAPQELADAQDAGTSIRSGGVRFEHARVDYPGTGFSLGPIDLNVEPGETVALVGPSGAGKSTLLELVPQLVAPDSGRLCFESGLGTPTLSDVRAVCAYVPQEPYFFEGTVRENLLFASPMASPEAIARACAAAHVDEFLQRLPEGFDARVSRGALNLSVGQRQRLAVARAMLVDPLILLLDEPTSSLDAESEHLLVDALRQFCQDRTTILVTHRPMLLALAHRVVTLRGGRIESVVTGQRKPASTARVERELVLH